MLDQYIDTTDYNNLASYEYVEELGSRISELAANINAATYRLLVLIEEFDREVGWRGGFLSCAHWLNYACGISLGAAREKVRVANALPGLPKIGAAFELGEISYSKVRALTRIAIPENEDYLLMIARYGTAAHMEKLVGCYSTIKRREQARRQPELQEKQSLDFYFDEDGMLVIRGRFTPEQGALILKALEAGTEGLAEISTETPQELPMAQRRAGALVDMAETFLSQGRIQRSGADRYLVMVHAGPDALRDEPDCTLPALEPGRQIPAQTARRLACDASLVAVREDEHGEPLNIGRRSRSIPPALRRALRLRDQGCRFPGCTRVHHLDGHHIEHWANGGETSLGNLVSLCRTHHALVHEGGFTIKAGESGEPVFLRPDGSILPASPPLMRCTGELIDDPDLRERIKKRKLLTWDGVHMDYAMAIDGLVAAERDWWEEPHAGRPAPVQEPQEDGSPRDAWNEYYFVMSNPPKPKARP